MAYERADGENGKAEGRLSHVYEFKAQSNA
jgi:hypothetical protein